MDATKEVEHGMKCATIVKQISLTFLLHFKSSSTFLILTGLIMTAEKQFGYRWLSWYPAK